MKHVIHVMVANQIIVYLVQETIITNKLLNNAYQQVNVVNNLYIQLYLIFQL